MEVRRARGVDLTPGELYGLLRLRVDVFVVEQRCAYAELDGRDRDPDTVHLWVPGGPDGVTPVVGCLRLLTEPERGSRDRQARQGAEPGLTDPSGGVRRIGRVCVTPTHRGRGVAGRLVRAALAEVGGTACVLDAQAHLVALYGGFGFVPDGPGYEWDGVPHVPMRRAPGTTRPRPPAHTEEGAGHD